ncbi:hypothetical protein LXL04_000581 [Taraxacum kok-saghyz]
MCTAHEGNFVNPPTGTKIARQIKTKNSSSPFLTTLAFPPAQTFDARKPSRSTFDDAKTLPSATTLAGKPATCPALMSLPISGFFDDINAMFFLVDEMPPAIGEYMSMMLFESDEDQPLEDESDEDQPTEKEGDEGADLEEDDLVDEENNVPKVEVDMADFTLNLDGDESEIHIDGGAADEEVDVDLDNLGKEKRRNLGNVHKASFYVGQKFKSKKELKDLIDAHAIQKKFRCSGWLAFKWSWWDKIFRAKAAATKLMVGDYTKQYEILRDYCLELQATNPGTTIKIDVYSDPNPSNPTRMFKRIYICLGPLKQGFKAYGRDILGFDGAFMKGPFRGQVLTAVGLDSNNGIYPVAYVIVESENMASWKWFLDCLGDDLDLGINSNFTFITDRQKGLIPAICSRFPHAEHRFCPRHIYQNMKRDWKPTIYNDYLWKCATATTIPDFYDKAASDWLKKIPPKQWARSHFTGRAITDILLNNLCEVGLSFWDGGSSKLIDGRDNPIIGSLEYIRQYLMKRICNIMKVMDNATGPLTPTATSILEANTSHASKYKARWNGGDKYQVTGVWQDQHVVDVRNNNCSCRKWELIGIPCKHAIATLNEMTKNSEDVTNIYMWVNKVYWLDTWKEPYSYKVQPIKGRIMWPKSLCPTKLTPPRHHTQVGRPKKKKKQNRR